MSTGVEMPASRHHYGWFMKLWAGRGFTSLAAIHPAGFEPKGQRFEHQTIEFSDRLRHKHVRLIVAPEGLYVRPFGLMLMMMPPLLIPWSEIVGTEATRLYMKPARRLLVGQPQIGSLIVWAPVFTACRPYLKAGRRPAE